MEKEREVLFLVGGGTLEEYLASLERRKSEQPEEESPGQPPLSEEPEPKA